MKNFFQKLHYDGCSCFLYKLAKVLLLPANAFYQLVVWIRDFLYDVKLLNNEKLPAYVISIGNLTTGGTGKTPVTAEIANRLTSMGKRVAVISRGYGGGLDVNTTNVISDGDKIFYTAEEAGEEPFWIAENAPGTVVITGKNRVKSGRLAIDKFNCDVLLVDDGFQHKKLDRDIDIVLIDGERGFGNGMLLPAGPLREPVSNIKRADKVVIVDKNGSTGEKIQRLQGVLKVKYGKESCVCGFAADKIYNIATGQPAGKIKTAVAFAGIAQPESFFRLLTAEGIVLAAKKVFSDHYSYSREDMDALIGTALSINADAVITTEKDAVKIKPYLAGIDAQIPVYALKLKVDLDNIVMLNLFQHLTGLLDPETSSG